MSTTHYLIDHEYLIDEEALFGEFGHLLAFNPGSRDAHLKVTVYFEDQEPKEFSLVAPAGKSTETNYARWPVEPNTRFALRVESDESIVCQSTNGWNVTKNDYSPDAETKSPLGVRECAKSYMAITQLAKDWYVADCIVIDNPKGMYVRESEWAIFLNPGDAPATVKMALHYDSVLEHVVEVPARRLAIVYIDDVGRRNVHGGAHFSSDQPIAAQWLRAVLWNDSDEVMAFWSVPCVPGPLE
ncbi:MAG: hypothetical protein GX620_11220 [Chloroflexi bacterium]|nr:hypothetical protein [Chloroflexota bacterium]